MTTENEFIEQAAQLWCLPQHAHKVMDAEFAESIAQVLQAAEKKGKKKGMIEGLEIAGEIAQSVKIKAGNELGHQMNRTSDQIAKYILERADELKKEKL